MIDLAADESFVLRKQGEFAHDQNSMQHVSHTLVL
jgi:hypothetical protein